MLNEFRKDLVSGEWVLFATGRAHSFRKHDPDPYQPKEECPFEGLENPGQKNQYIIGNYPEPNDWSATIIKNKFSAVRSDICTPEKAFGPFKTIDAVGDHEVIVYRDHDKSIYDFSLLDFSNVIKVYKKRFTELATREQCNKYILIFHNQGKGAGASIYHPHSQIITTPILPPDVFRSLNGSYEYYKKHKKMVYSELLEWEEKEGTRIVYENEHFLVFCPYVSKYPYELRIFGKESHAHFNQMPDNMNESLADAYYTALQKLKIALDKPPFNMFIHTAPTQNEFGVHSHEFYSWHIEIIPHLKIDAGFELGTGIEVNIVDPNESAEVLRNVSIE
ncbi:MAG: galactose-1-phosphate uridylyltransferase [Candidatus Yanofskybacteria bacterium RIFCSPHIGHO2_02_FULL_39_10]|uniref:Galactose-1-phosphate uridylyltransferase n=1 Tax=Candidatus Yanofskybacteria bacterium RIFCSPHIGHO2_02_FULL_39_10 TaxID=1802674 RepID=A0A1F8F9E9_9BACT|nr:MAG: galactose-1-phosphate uridylyltransferase [Candidatus Yanofskybacteria bacterium RIFCSPHIGHO2_02_FULL_39_10]